jgi:hypothetical protein
MDTAAVSTNFSYSQILRTENPIIWVIYITFF